MTIKKPKISDAPIIQQIINTVADQGKLLPRSLNEIYDNFHDFWIKEIDGQIAGCVALHVTWYSLGEVRSLVVKEEFRGRGIGKELVETCFKEAENIGLEHLFALTYVPDFFKKFNFYEVTKERLPHKIWNDCIKCIKFPNCNETALMFDINTPDT